MLVDQYERPLITEDDSEESKGLNIKRPLDIRAITGGRLTREKEGPTLSSFFTVQPPAEPEEDWQKLNLDEQTLKNISARNLKELLINLSPEINLALWHFLRFCNPGYEIKCDKKSAQKVIDEFIEELDRMYGSFDILLSKIFTGCFVRGAIFVELVLNRNGTEAIDLVVLDPAVARFKEAVHPERGPIDELGQYHDGQWVSYQDDETIIYAALDPMLDGYYGRSLISSSLFAAVFLLGLLHDLRRVISQQGYPRLDISIDLEKLTASMPIEERNDPEKLERWIKAAIKEIGDYYSALEPDDAFVHTDASTVNATAAAAASLQGIETIIRFVERMLIRSLKSSPILMGSNETVTESHADRQWAIHMAGIRSVQNRLKKVLQRILGVVLQVRGIQSKITVTFDELDASEGLKKAMTEYQITLAILQKVSGGLITLEDAQDEMNELSLFKHVNKLYKKPTAPPAETVAIPPAATPPENPGDRVAEGYLNDIRGLRLARI